MDGSFEIPPPSDADPTVNVVILSMDANLEGPVRAAESDLRRAIPGISIKLHPTTDWSGTEKGRAQVIANINSAHVIVAGMLFLEEQFEAILPALQQRAPVLDAFVGILSAPEIVKLTQVGKFRMDKPQNGAISLLKRLKPKKASSSNGEGQAKILRRLPKLLKYVPGTAQDLRSYFLTMQYWLGGSADNVRNMVATLVDRYAAESRAAVKGRVEIADPIVYPEVGLYHPDMQGGVSSDVGDLPNTDQTRPTVGVLILRSYALSGDTAHYDGAIRSLEAKGLRVIPAFASGLDNRPAVEAYFKKNGETTIDALVSLTGFSLVGGPAYNDAEAAAETLADLDVPYVAAHSLEFQSMATWGGSSQGLSPVESTIMVAIPELDGATGPTVFGGRATPGDAPCDGCDRSCNFTASGGVKKMQGCPERAEALASRVAQLIRLRKTPRKDRKIAVALFNFPPNSGATGTAAFLAVYASLFNLLKQMKAEGYTVDVPESVDALRDSILVGNAAQYGADANVHHLVSLDDHVRRERRLNEIEEQWGPAPGRQQTDGQSIQILGVAFGNVLVTIQPSFGFEGDPMRLLFENSFTPTHAFAAYYRYLRDGYGAHAVLHFGTHGALEFMPGKQVSLSARCWPSYLIDDLPNIYFYASNNPSEAAIAKRRSAATTVSYLTGSVTKAELYKSLADLKSTVDRWRGTDPAEASQRMSLAVLAQAQAASLDLAKAEPAWDSDAEAEMLALFDRLTEYESALIPDGLHEAGAIPDLTTRTDILLSMAGEGAPDPLPDDAIRALAAGHSAARVASEYDLDQHRDRLLELVRVNEELQKESELAGLITALDGRFIKPAPGGDLLNNSSIVPTGRNIHGFDPFRLPSAFAVRDGAEQAQRLLDRHSEDTGCLPESVAIVLWGTDNLKSEGAQIAQALALMGAAPRFDSYGRLAGASLIPLEELGRPRVDVIATLSGIFRDMLPMQTRLLAQAALEAAGADEPIEQNFIRKHALGYQAEHGCDLETAALRVFSNADGAYGANVNALVDAGAWQNEDDLAQAYTNRKCFAYGVDGQARRKEELLGSILADVDLAYQNLESVELGVTTIDHYFDTLGGIGRAARSAANKDLPVYIGDQTQGEGKVRTLDEQVSLESRTRTLNPKWYEGMLKHGYEGVRQIEAQLTNTLGWSATTGKVQPWVYQEITETFVLDPELRNRLAALNPKACSRLANRLIEASERNYWSPDDETREQLNAIGEELEDRIEGILPADASTA